MPAWLTLTPDPAQTDRLGLWLKTLADAAAWPADLASAVELCLDEVVTNIAMHGGSTVGDIAVEIDHDAVAVIARIEDGGAKFDPTAETQPLPESLDDAKIGGLGLFLVRRLSTEMHYERIGGRNRLTLRFNLKAGST
jgi:anti-sigma regulatory factor (Ser/Thr protein kinase)